VYEDIPLSEVPEGRILIPTKWVYDYKTDHQNRIIDHKARLVANGFRQTPGEDFGETYAPTIQEFSFSIVASICCRILVRNQSN
jgi:hypothetical protein